MSRSDSTDPITQSPDSTVDGRAAGDQRLTLTVDEVAQRLGISRSAVYDCIGRGEIPAKRLGRRVVVVRSAFEAFLAQPDQPRRPSKPRLRRLA